MSEPNSPLADPAKGRIRGLIRVITRPGEQLGHKAVNAGFWAFGLSLSNRLLRTVRTVLIARLLAPEDLGLMGVALLTLTFMNTFTQTGFRRALIQRKGAIEEDLNTAWTIELMRAALIGGILILSAPLVVSFFDAPDALGVIRVMGFATILVGFENIAVVMFDKDLEFQRRFVYRSIPNVVDLIVAVAAAFALRSVWALVLGILARNITTVIASYLVHPFRPRFEFNIARAKRLSSFGIWVFFSGILTYTYTNLDDIVVGRVVDVAALGLYQIAFTLSQIVTTELTSVINQVALPAYAKIQDAIPRLRAAYLRSLQLVALMAVPMAAGLYFVGEDLVRVFLGQKWLPMVSAFEILLLWGLLRSVGATAGPLFHGVGRPSVLVRTQIVMVAVLIVIVYPMTQRWGIEGAAWSTVLAAIPSTAIGLSLAGRIIDATPKDFLARLGFPVVNSALMVAAIWALRNVVDSRPVINLIWTPPVGAIVYFGLVLIERRAFQYLEGGILISNPSPPPNGEITPK